MADEAQSRRMSKTFIKIQRTGRGEVEGETGAEESLPPASEAEKAFESADDLLDGGLELSDVAESAVPSGTTGSTKRSAAQPAVLKGRRDPNPLSALLPKLGDLTQLVAFRASINEKLRQAQGRAATESESGSHRDHASEEAMLNQVSQWLSIGVEK